MKKFGLRYLRVNSAISMIKLVCHGFGQKSKRGLLLGKAFVKGRCLVIRTEASTRYSINYRRRLNQKAERSIFQRLLSR